MTPERFRPDNRLTIRIAETWVLLLLITGGYGALLGLLLHQLTGVPWWIGLALPAAGALVSYTQDDVGRHTKDLDVVDADPVHDHRLIGAVQRVSALADAPIPKLKIIEVDWANAVAFHVPGRRPVVAVSRGLLNTVDDASLDAVLAHELAHVVHHDAAVMTMATNVSSGLFTLPGYLVDAFSAVDRCLCWLARQCGYAWRPIDLDKDDETPSTRDVNPTLRKVLAVTVLPPVGLLRALNMLLILPFGIVTLPVVVLSVIPVVVALSRLRRYRELAADRSAALLTTQPMALAAALTSLDHDGPRIPAKDLRDLRALSSMAIVPLPVERPDSKAPQLVARVFGSHPPIEQRVERLTELARDLVA
jgi:heat shock protein HtpX